MADYDLTYGSIGAGVQSTALAVLSALGLRGVPRMDVGIFSDTQCEPAYVYEQVEFLRDWLHPHGIPLVTVTAGNLADDVIARHAPGEQKKRFAAIPAWTRGDDGRERPLRRQCTREYKIEPITREVRRRIGKGRGKRARALIGISADEAGRQKPSKVGWVDNTYPLVEAGITRAGCEQAIRELGLPLPKKSACVCCPYHDDAYWQDLKDNHPDDWQEACRLDEAFRDMTASGIPGPVYLHRSLRPLREVDLDPRPKRYPLGLFDSGFGDECEGMCGV